VSEYGLPDYEEKDYSYEGITITLPDEFELQKSSTSIYWEKPEWSDMYIGLSRSNDIPDAADYAKFRADDDYEKYSGKEDYKDVHKGTIEIDGLTCYYCEYTNVTDYSNRYNYWLGIPIASAKKVVSVDVSFDADGIYNETDRELRDRIVNSIKID
jgi:hypothetical protein